MIYLDNAATSLYRPDEVEDAMLHAMRMMGNSARGNNDAAMFSARLIYETRELISDLFHADGPESVVFTMNATMALNMVIHGLIKQGDHVITTAMDHNSVLRPLYAMQQQGVDLTILKCTDDLNIDYEQLEESIRPETKAVICTHASNLTGRVIDIHRVGKICRKHGIYFILDASQTAGCLELNMKKDHIDLLCFTGHKGLLGPQGTGGFCVRKGIELIPMMYGGTGLDTFRHDQPVHMPERMEAGTLNGHGIAGLKAAIIWLNSVGIDNIQRKEQSLLHDFITEVSRIHGIVFYGNERNANKIAVTALNLYDMDSLSVCELLAKRYDIHTRGGGHCAPLMHETLGTKKQGAVRFSFSYYNTNWEVEQTVQALRELSADYCKEYLHEHISV